MPDIQSLKYELNEKISDEYILKQAAEVTELDIRKFLAIAPEIIEKIKTTGPLRKYFEDARKMIGIISKSDSLQSESEQEKIKLMVYALMYVYNPGDIIPDYIPGAGYVDDEVVLSRCIELIKGDLG
jgi:uncharacterized membrane protein YkvA (DUF1232 family)